MGATTTREASAQEFEAAAAELEAAAKHLRVAAQHMRDQAVPRSCAHAFAAEGHLATASQAITRAAQTHASHASAGEAG